MEEGPAERADWCASIRAARAEAIWASAPALIANWLLVEHPGPWPIRGLPDDLPPAVRGVLERAEDRGVRLQLIRRVRDRRPDLRTVVVAGRGADGCWAEQRRVRELEELCALDLDALAAGRPPGFGAPVDPDEPLVLVCTHGRRDVCCARLGRPVAVALDARLPGRVWETTHVGGDRFAANTVTLPGGGYHGGLTAEDVDRLVPALDGGRVLLERWRGACGIPGEQQAADYAVRHLLGETRLHAVRCVSAQAGTDAESRVRLAVGDREFLVSLRRVVQEPRRTSCADGGTISAPAGYEVISLDEVTDAAARASAAGVA
ncbi:MULTISPECIES: sucrase ferredoxin [Microbacterium]|uniref:sucrase ferredoxin n=1 Tax=Microbacterium TaxID=33882 RepID=UPI00217F0899|nr:MULTISPECIES: sucrase ferredoxin [Microbacterium]UWF76947.1 sucrase ferredoxin [Microbacterium neungamense]WCM55107.1 sucrase ferredoxin [Microbacterium sp. EF45047]